MRIALDIGHMGKASNPEDRGACNNIYREADFALEYAVKARRLLEENGHIVYLLCHENYAQRFEFCDYVKVEAHFQCHVNAPDGSYALLEYRDKAHSECSKISSIIGRHLKEGLGDIISKVDIRILKEADRGYSCLKSNIPSILFEPLFIGNATHLNFLLNEDGINKVGTALADGLHEWSAVHK